MQEDWCTWRDCESSDVLAAENRAVLRVFEHWGGLSGLLGGALMVDGAMVGYTVAEALTPQSVVIHFEKGDTQLQRDLPGNQSNVPGPFRPGFFDGQPGTGFKRRRPS